MSKIILRRFQSLDYYLKIGETDNVDSSMLDEALKYDGVKKGVSRLGIADYNKVPNKKEKLHWSDPEDD